MSLIVHASVEACKAPAQMAVRRYARLPPAAPLPTEARVLATQMGQVVMVVQADKTLQADVQQALATIEACPVKMMLLNKVRAEGKGSYGYGYGYGHGYGRKKQAA